MDLIKQAHDAMDKFLDILFKLIFFYIIMQTFR